MRRRPALTAGRDDERGSVLILMPVAVLIVVLLGGIAVDSAVQFMAQRQLVEATQAAANDAATRGVSASSLRRGSGYVLDPAEVDRVVRESFAARGMAPSDVEARVVGAQVVVRARRRVRLVFSAALLGGRERTVEASGSAEAEQQR